MSVVFTIIILMFLVSGAYAIVAPNSLFADNAVLQRDMSVPIWGTAKSGEAVTVSFQGQKVTTTAKNGKWLVRLKPLKAGGPFTMAISGENTIELKNILVGEVWVAGGQSNMQMGLNGCEYADQVIAASADPMIRLLTAQGPPSNTPLTETLGAWKECLPATSSDFSAVAYFFGRELRKSLNVPIGLISANWGGTCVQAWTPDRYIENASALRRQRPKGDPNGPSVLYSGRIAPLMPYAIRGAIWYQGESNVGEAYKYRAMFPNMIKSWREDWGEGDFPFLFVQIAPFGTIVTEPTESDWAELREAQLLTSQTCSNTAMAVITDVGDPVDIHPKKKQKVGERLALAARALAHKEKIIYQGPVYKAMKVKGDSIILSFDSIGSGLEAKGGELTGFTIAGEDRKFRNAQAAIIGKAVTVKSSDVPHPAAVRFGWSNCPVVNLFNKEDIPASPFRTDDWPGVTWPK